MSMNRRQFIKRTGVAAAGGFVLPALFRSPWVEQALAAPLSDRYLVVLFLDGGNDGLNTIVPSDDGGAGLRAAYEAARNVGAGGLRLTPAQLLVPSAPFTDANTGAQLGFHPALGGFNNLYNQGRLAVIQGCGYPNHNLSHEVSRSIWETANPLGLNLPGGWVGRYLAGNYGSTQIPGVCVRESLAGEFAQTTTSVLAVPSLRDFGFPYDDYWAVENDNDLKRTAFLNLCAAASAGAPPVRKLIGDSGAATLYSSESYPPLDALYRNARPDWNQAYAALDTSTARRLREVAKIIRGVEQGVPNVNARFFELANGGYDTHSDQGAANPTDQHYRLLEEIGDAIELFYNDCDDMGIAHKVCVMVWSEFSRRIPQNDNGTDHGSQGPMFVIGGAVNGGLYGNHPNIATAALDDDGNTVYSQAPGGFRSTDFRDVYGTILKHWVNLSDAEVSAILPADTGPASSYWTVPNFDLGFL